MKTIHILPTDKPSRFSLNSNGKYHLTNQLYSNSPNFINQNIYITSDKKIKEGDYYYNERLNQVFQAIRKSGYNTMDREFKITLTTDKNLIADGIQAIDDEFIEWFVKNPSCEVVEVIPLRKSSGWYDEKNVWHWDFLAYKIIIPKEEPKQIKCYCGHTITCDCGELELECKDCNKSLENCTCIEDTVDMKQETLEEASERIGNNFEEPSFKAGVVYGIIEGAKWQQKRSYSEEEVYNLILKMWNDLGNVKSTNHRVFTWFEQFKKK